MTESERPEPGLITSESTVQRAGMIELGGLVQKAGLVELTGDDRATLLGAMLELADQLRDGRTGDSRESRTAQQLAATWRHRGLRAFEADKNAVAA